MLATAMYIMGLIFIPLFFYLLYKVDHIERIMVDVLWELDKLETILKEEQKRR